MQLYYLDNLNFYNTPILITRVIELGYIQDSTEVAKVVQFLGASLRPPPCRGSASGPRWGPSIKDVSRDGEGIWSNADRGRGQRTFRTSARWHFFRIVSACFADTPYGWWLLKYKLLFVLSDLHQSIIWAGTKAYVYFILRARLLITWPTYQLTWGRSKMPRWWDQWAAYFENSCYTVRL